MTEEVVLGDGFALEVLLLTGGEADELISAVVADVEDDNTAAPEQMLTANQDSVGGTGTKFKPKLLDMKMGPPSTTVVWYCPDDDILTEFQSRLILLAIQVLP